MRVSEHRLPSGSDSISLRLFAPPAAPSSIIVMPSAMGVPQSFYAHYAEWLAARGHLVATFDYRGIGRSAPARLRGYAADLYDWAADCAAVIDFVDAQAPGLPLYWIGHSLGGQLVGLIRNRARIARIATIAAGSGYWLENSWPTRRMVWLMWFGVVPLALPLFGYFPGKRLRMVGDVPRAAMAQWRRWCLDPEYVVGVEGDEVRAAYAAIQTPILSLSFSDDEMMSARSVRSLHRLYAGAPVEYRRLTPADVGAAAIGHFGFFRPQFDTTLWPQVADWLTGAAAAGATHE